MPLTRHSDCFQKKKKNDLRSPGFFETRQISSVRKKKEYRKYLRLFIFSSSSSGQVGLDGVVWHFAIWTWTLITSIAIRDVKRNLLSNSVLRSANSSFYVFPETNFSGPERVTTEQPSLPNVVIVCISDFLSSLNSHCFRIKKIVFPNKQPN